ncbi:MAG: GNAT family N-acetyltransferase [Anaerolineae bacterium]|nr:GNAT family N-acetyltransferase [Anaerolineae bacterium]
MMSAFAEKLQFREGQADDWPAVSRITDAALEGHDYIDQSIWEMWTSDSPGTVIAATYNEHIVGFGRVTLLGPAEWWIEGLRVHPDLQGKGVAAAVTDQLLAWFKQHGDGILRLAAENTNEAIVTIAEQNGFRHTVSYHLMEAAPTLADYSSFKVLESQNLDLLHNYLRHSPMYRINHFAERYQRLYYLTKERLADYLADDQQVHTLGWKQMDQLQGVAILFLTPPEGRKVDEDALYIGYLDAVDDTTLTSMMMALRGLAAKRGNSKLTWQMASGFGLDGAAAKADLEAVWSTDESLWLFELPIR